MRLYRQAGVLLVLLTGFLAVRTDAALADQVILTDGDRISGRIICVSKDTLQIESPALGILEIKRKYVEQLSTEDYRIIDLLSGERVVGRLISAGGKAIIIRSSILGDRRVPLDTIVVVQTPVRSGDRSTGTPLEEGVNPASLAQVQGKGSGSSTQRNPSANPAQTEQPKSIGQKPEDVGDIRKIFLRQSTVLLQPRQAEIDVAFNYQHTQAVSTILSAKVRQFQLPLAVRAGLFKGGEGYLTVPVTYIRRDLGFVDSVVSHEETGIGDAAIGLNYELVRETASRPDIVVSAGLTTPTGSKPNEQGLSLGAGHWAANIGLQFIKIYDPVALFGGLIYAHQFEARYFLNDDVHKVNPGETAGYNFGFGFAVNENISLSAQVAASYQSDMRADGSKIFASSREPVSLRSALTFRHSKRTYIEPSVTIGLDNDTPDFAFGFSWTRRSGK
jgi:hypothetical protein